MTVEAAAVSRDMRVASFRVAALPLALAAVLLLAAPLLLARPANLTSDESLYLAEAYNIAHGKGMTYPSGEPITHRAPLFPLVLAPAIALAGPGAAHTVTRAVAVINALLLLLLAWRMAGALAGAIAGCAAAASSFLSGLGTTLYLDPMQCTFMLLTLLALHEAAHAATVRWCAVAGLCLAAAFLVKESAVQWAPLGVLAWLAVPTLRNAAGARAALAFTLVFVAGVAGWWTWFWLETGQVYMLGAAGTRSVAMLVAAGAGLTAFALAVVLWPRAPDGVSVRARRIAVLSAAALVVVWGAFMLYGLTRYSSWGYPNNYWSSVPRYLTSVAPAAQPFFLIVAAWVWLAWRAATRRDDASVLIASAALLFAPFALFAANRQLQLRDALPLVYLSYIVLGIAVADGLRALRAAIREPLGEWLLFAALIVVSAGFALHEATYFLSANQRASTEEVRLDSWDNPFARRIAAWMDGNLPAESHLLTSRLYFSSLHVATGARFEIRQMPTVRVDVDPARDGLLVPRSNLFRWGDLEQRPGRPGDQWLYLKQFPGKAYWVGLSQQELLDYIAAHAIDYVVLTGDDVAFSSIAYADYFSAHPAFRLLHTDRASASDQLFVFAVDRSRLAPIAHSTVITPASFAALQRETGLDADGIERLLGTHLRVTDGDGGLSDREQWAAVAGIDLGAR